MDSVYKGEEMYKVIFNNLVIDIMEKPRYTRFLPKSERVVGTDRLAATGIMSSNGEEVYHLEGKTNNYPEKLKTVQLIKIEKEEFERLKSQKTEIKEETLVPAAVQSQIDALAAMVSQLSAQNQTLLQQIEEINRGEG